MSILFFFFFNDTATTEIYPLSLHDALPISPRPAGLRFYHTHNRAGADLHAGQYSGQVGAVYIEPNDEPGRHDREVFLDRKSTRLNSSHSQISYAVFCLKKKNRQTGCIIELL